MSQFVVTDKQGRIKERRIVIHASSEHAARYGCDSEHYGYGQFKIIPYKKLIKQKFFQIQKRAWARVLKMKMHKQAK